VLSPDVTHFKSLLKTLLEKRTSIKNYKIKFSIKDFAYFSKFLKTNNVKIDSFLSLTVTAIAVAALCP
jgi:hypothetical protein